MSSTSLAYHRPDDVIVRGRSLCHDLIGKRTFTEMAYFLVTGTEPTAPVTAVVDACLVALMEHGLTPSALASRLTYSGAPESMQGAVAAGLLGVGGVFAGTMEGCAALLTEIVAHGPQYARVLAEGHHREGRRVPGFGHPTHKPDDPRALRIIEVARDQGVAGAHVSALLALAAAVDETQGKHLTVNVTGAIAAALGDCGVPAAVMRGFALITRSAGLVAHLHEEQQHPAAGAIWAAADRAVPYDVPCVVPDAEPGTAAT